MDRRACPGGGSRRGRGPGRGAGCDDRDRRRDLTTLERHALLRRVHGGAIPIERLGFEPALAARDSVFTAEKERIARLALAELPRRGLDPPGRRDHDRPARRCPAIGPRARGLDERPARSRVALGPAEHHGPDRWAAASVAGPRRRSTRGPCRRSPTATSTSPSSARTASARSAGLTTPDTTESAVKRAMIRAARRSVVLADHTKVGQDHLSRFAALDEIDTLITDSGLDSQVAGELRSGGLKVLLA